MNEIGSLTGRRREPSSAGTGAPSPRILVAEDNTDLRTCIREVFEMSGFSVDTCSNGLDAVERASRRRYDVLVSDIRLPGMSGLEVGRSLGKGPHPPRILFITAFPDWKVLKEAREAGAEHVLNKPLDLRRLAEVVGKMASDARLEGPRQG